ncbi:MAG: hypothetical protein AABW99_02885 [archaeon]
MLFKNLLRSQFEHANIGLAIVFFLLPTLFLSGSSLALGFSMNFAGLAVLVARELIYFVLASILMFVLLMGFKGAETKGKFLHIMSAYSVNYLVVFCAALIAVILVALFIPGFFPKIASLQGTNPSIDDLALAINSIDLPSQAIVLLLEILFLAVGIAAIILNFWIFYSIGQIVKATSLFSNLVFTVVFVGLSFLLGQALGFVLSI